MPVVRVKTYQHICFPCVHIFHLLLSFHHHPLFQCFLRLSPWRKTHFSTIRLENLFCICDGGYFGSGSPLNVYVQVCVCACMCACVCVHVCVFVCICVLRCDSSVHVRTIRNARYSRVFLFGIFISLRQAKINGIRSVAQKL